MDKLIPEEDPEQMRLEDGVACTSGVGLTVTSKFEVFPTQKVGVGPVGVITYLTTPGDVPELVSVCPIFVPHEDAQSLKPVILPPVGAVV